MYIQLPFQVTLFAVYSLLIWKGSKQEQLFRLRHVSIISCFMILDVFYVLLTLRYNMSIHTDSTDSGLYRRDVGYMMMLRVMVNMWLYANFLWYGCCQKDV